MGEPIQGDDGEPEEPSLVVDEMAAPEQWEEPELEGFLIKDEPGT